MYDPCLTSQTLYAVCVEKCEKHGVNFQYVYSSVLKTHPQPITLLQLENLIEAVVCDGFWSDYDRLYEGIGYPEHAIRKTSHDTKRND